MKYKQAKRKLKCPYTNFDDMQWDKCEKYKIAFY